MPPKKKGGDEFDHRPFAALEALAGHKPGKKQKKKRAEPLAETPAEKPTVPGASAALDHIDNDELLFANAVANLDATSIHRGKYGDHESKAERTTRKAAQKALSPVERDAQDFAAVMGRDGVRRLGGKHIPKVLPRPSLTKENLAEVQAGLEARAADPHGLTSAQRRFRRDVKDDERRHGPVPMLSLRGMRSDDAGDRLIAFIRSQRQQGQSVIRVIAGKGNQSDGEPVLKHLVGRLLEGRDEVVECAPEINSDGDFGAWIARLKR